MNIVIFVESMISKQIKLNRTDSTEFSWSDWAVVMA